MAEQSNLHLRPNLHGVSLRHKNKGSNNLLAFQREGGWLPGLSNPVHFGPDLCCVSLQNKTRVKQSSCISEGKVRGGGGVLLPWLSNPLF